MTAAKRSSMMVLTKRYNMALRSDGERWDNSCCAPNLCPVAEVGEEGHHYWG